ncbi:MAG: sortase [Patescibacteria group bacterium]|nr:sortase [Patescibacteria group bacterium]
MDISPPNPQPQNDQSAPPNADVAADLIRDKVSRIYEAEPDAKQEIAEATHVPHRSKHQQFMYDLSSSGQDLAAVQTAWHNYYQSLPAHEQHQVWQEFYASQSAITAQPEAKLIAPSPVAVAEHKQQVIGTTERAKKQAAKPKPRKFRDVRSTKDVQDAIRETVTAGGKLDRKHHIQSLLFGLGMGLLVVIIFLFGFFNEVIIAPFIQPSRAAASTPLIVSETSVAATDKSEVIIPKINVQIPTDFSQNTTVESDIEKGLEKGVVHYPTTSKPGETGNAAFFGHSSNNIFNKGKYKFAFVLLHTIVPGDTFYLTYNGKVYVYKVISKNVVDPSEVGVLDPIPGQTATATLITCDPPGTSLKRLVVVGQQISPDVSGNATVQTAKTVTAASNVLPGNGQTLLGRVLGSFIGKLFATAIIGGAIYFTVRWVKKPSRG